MEAFVILGIPGPWQIIILVIAMVFLFGGKKIPELMRGIGQGMKEFKKATRDDSDDGDDEVEKKIENGEA